MSDSHAGRRLSSTLRPNFPTTSHSAASSSSSSSVNIQTQRKAPTVIEISSSEDENEPALSSIRNKHAKALASANQLLPSDPVPFKSKSSTASQSKSTIPSNDLPHNLILSSSANRPNNPINGFTRKVLTESVPSSSTKGKNSSQGSLTNRNSWHAWDKSTEQNSRVLEGRNRHWFKQDSARLSKSTSQGGQNLKKNRELFPGSKHHINERNSIHEASLSLSSGDSSDADIGVIQKLNSLSAISQPRSNLMSKDKNKPSCSMGPDRIVRPGHKQSNPLPASLPLFKDDIRDLDSDCIENSKDRQTKSVTASPPLFQNDLSGHGKATKVVSGAGRSHQAKSSSNGLQKMASSRDHLKSASDGIKPPSSDAASGSNPSRHGANQVNWPTKSKDVTTALFSRPNDTGKYGAQPKQLTATNTTPSTSDKTRDTTIESDSPNVCEEAPALKRRKIQSTLEAEKIAKAKRITRLSDSEDDETDPPALAPLPPSGPPKDAPASQFDVLSKRLGPSTSNSCSSIPLHAPCVIHPLSILPPPTVTPRVRPQSPDWSKIPVHRRPLQGRERAGEYSADLQKTWILKNKPDLSTKLGHLIFSEEINSNQMWENPEIPRIDVIVPDEVRQKMIEDSKASHTSHEAKPSMIDNSLAPPLEFVYTDRLIYRTNERPIPPNWHCDCLGDCLNNPNCACRAHQTKMVIQILEAMNVDLDENLKNFEGFAYTSTRKSRNSHTKKPDNEDQEARCIREIFITARLPVFECNSLCGCGPDCINRTVGRGRREKLTIEKTLTRGWGVFADHSIPIGRLVTHYSGELITDAMSAERGQKKYEKTGRTYIFDLDPWWINTLHTRNLANEGLLVICGGDSVAGANESTIRLGSNPGSLSTTSAVIKKKSKEKRVEESNDVECLYSVDAFLYGNISRFINHSCNANTTVVPVYIEDSDPTRPIFTMFANKMIKTGKEITTSYSDPNPDEQDKIDKKAKLGGRLEPGYVECKCGAPNCRGIMFA